MVGKPAPSGWNLNTISPLPSQYLQSVSRKSLQEPSPSSPRHGNKPLEGQGRAAVGVAALGVGRADDAVGVGNREGAGRGVVGRAAEVDVLDRGLAVDVRVDRGDGPLGVDKGARLDEYDGTHARVDARRGDGVEVVAGEVARVSQLLPFLRQLVHGHGHGHGHLLVDVAGAEADRGRAAVDVGPLVVGIRDTELARILSGVAVRVADKRSLPLF